MPLGTPFGTLGLSQLRDLMPRYYDDNLGWTLTLSHESLTQLFVPRFFPEGSLPSGRKVRGLRPCEVSLSFFCHYQEEMVASVSELHRLISLRVTCSCEHRGHL